MTKDANIEQNPALSAGFYSTNIHSCLFLSVVQGPKSQAKFLTQKVNPKGIHLKYLLQTTMPLLTRRCQNWKTAILCCAGTWVREPGRSDQAIVTASIAGYIPPPAIQSRMLLK